MPNYELGPCQIYNNTDGSDLGKTHGGITLTIEETYQTLNTDQDGTTPVDERITGTQVTVTANLANITLSNIAFALKQDVSGSGATQHVLVTPNTGTSLLDVGKEICIKPYVGGVPTTNESDMILLPKAGIRANMNMPYDSDTQRVIALTLTGYPDSSIAGNIGTSIAAVFGASATTSSIITG